MIRQLYCHTPDAGIPHGWRDVTEIEDSEPVYSASGKKTYALLVFACGCRRLVEQKGAKP